MKFKIGDKVECIKGMCTGITGTINKINGIQIYANDWSDGIYGYLPKEELKLISSKKMAKDKTIKYILKYDLQDEEDPYESFATLDEVKKRIEELIAEGEGIIMSSIRVYEVKSVAKVETQVVFTK